MKKLLFASIFMAGTVLGFAKSNEKNHNENLHNQKLVLKEVVKTTTTKELLTDKTQIKTNALGICLGALSFTTVEQSIETDMMGNQWLVTTTYHHFVTYYYTCDN